MPLCSDLRYAAQKLRRYGQDESALAVEQAAILVEEKFTSTNTARAEILAHDIEDCTLVCLNYKKCFHAAKDGNIDIERGSEECKRLGGLIRSPIA